MNELYPVYTLKNECHDCYKCLRECPVKAIKIKDGHASVLNEKCIACGNCVKTCPSNAKRVRYDIEKIKTLFIAQKRVFVSLAPSWVGAFEFSSEKMIALLKTLGFSEVSETALGAQEVSIEVANFLRSTKQKLTISSACPVIVDFIRAYKPELVNYITPVASPALSHAKLLKQIYGDDISVVFIGPCIAKKNEADRHPELLDAAITFEELKYWIKEDFIDASKLEVTSQDIFVPERANEGSFYPIEAGMNETLKQIGIDKEVQLLAMSSLESLQRTLNGIRPEDIDSKIFIEALACPGGCTNGPCMATNKAGLTISSKVLKNVKIRDFIPLEPAAVVRETYLPKPIQSKNYPMEEIVAAMQKIGKHSEEDELNCGGCGYPTCRDLAAALLAGEAEPSMCVSYMRKIAMRKAAAMLRCMPSAMVMVDSDLNIVEANDAFLKMFCGDMYEIFSSRSEGLKGAAIDRIVDFAELFKSAFKSSKDIHKEHYSYQNRLYDINAFIVEPQQIAGAIITDVTQSEMNREKIAHKAQEVITKNIAIVQDIACLLGEHMVETELLLSSIAEDFDIKTSSDKKE